MNSTSKKLSFWQAVPLLAVHFELGFVLCKGGSLERLWCFLNLSLWVSFSELSLQRIMPELSFKLCWVSLK